MHRAILESWALLLMALAAALGALWVCARLNSARFAPARLRRLHGCQAGSVQTLSFILTLPVFIMVVLFIIQVSQLMIGVTVVHYAAFAAARAASVWIPAEAGPEAANTLDPASFDANAATFPDWLSQNVAFDAWEPGRNGKYEKIWSAAVMACAPLGPSRRVLQSAVPPAGFTQSMAELYRGVVPQSAANAYFTERLMRKVEYARFNTFITMRGTDRDWRDGPTYNPYPGYYETRFDPLSGQAVRVWIPYNPNELNWQAPITVSVYHNFALLPGPGRFLATLLVSGDTPDLVSRKIKRQTDALKGRNVRYVVLSAECTIVPEGIKSVLPYAQPMD